MDRNEKKNKRKKWLILCLALCILFVACIMVFQVKGRQQMVKWTMKEPVNYDKSIVQGIEQLWENDMDVVFWQENKSETVINLDYNRSVEVKTMGIAGDASVLFPDSNRLTAGETGYCILGTDTAWQLFGSTRIIGRSVQINGETYQVAGIEYQDKKLCVYELAPDRNQEIAYAAIHFKNRQQLEMDKHKLEMIMDISLCE